MRKQIIISSIIAVTMSLWSCIDRFYMDGSGDGFTPKLIIEGIISNDVTLQEIVISQSSSPEEPRFSPVSYCSVWVEDDRGNRFAFHESEAGHYYGNINESYMVTGVHYRLVVETSDGKKCISNYEELMPCPPVDSIYYELKSKPTSDPMVWEDGLQFYIDYKGMASSGRYFLWKLEETYEYHSTWPMTRYRDENGVHQLNKADYSAFTCYKTENIIDVFTLSTFGFTRNSYQKYPLHFVNDHTQRLMFKYSVLAKQYSLTESAFQFWNNLQKNNKEATGIFGKQPAIVKGNIYNANDSSELVLGYFGVSSVTMKRILVPSVAELHFNEVSSCYVTKPPEGQGPGGDPLYWAQGIDENGVPFWGEAAPECFICTLLGGTTQKPLYWDKQ